jgi:hypothetical protein
VQFGLHKRQSFDSHSHTIALKNCSFDFFAGLCNLNYTPRVRQAISSMWMPTLKSQMKTRINNFDK